MSDQPCTWNEGGTVKEPKICGKVCDAGKTLCPRHDAMRSAKLSAQVERDRKPQRASSRKRTR